MNVSVTIPAWNAAGTIAETLESLRAQTFPGWEAIGDDGSTDQMAAIAANFAEQDTWIRMVSQPQAGERVARNTGMCLARLDYGTVLQGLY
ncbi:MAG: glycosyltransferase [Anaerolineae bacterium]|nr:glycosyltransferase [Anaerolineae bacterium]